MKLTNGSVGTADQIVGRTELTNPSKFSASSVVPSKKEINTYSPEINFLTVDEFEQVPKYVH